MMISKKNLDQFIEGQLDKSNELEDPVLPYGINVYCYEMKKIGRGWKTLSQEWSNTGSICNYKGVSDDHVLKGYETLSKIKDKHDGTYTVPFVVDGNLCAPSMIFQIIVDCRSIEEKTKVLEILTGTHKGMNYTTMLQYKYGLMRFLLLY
jgi:hypothetical protein